ncbi:MAG: hypothetical protein COA52_05330, partial [Hyphomicrobiales bacterium]
MSEQKLTNKVAQPQSKAATTQQHNKEEHGLRDDAHDFTLKDYSVDGGEQGLAAIHRGTTGFVPRTGNVEYAQNGEIKPQPLELAPRSDIANTPVDNTPQTASAKEVESLNTSPSNPDVPMVSADDFLASFVNTGARSEVHDTSDNNVRISSPDTDAPKVGMSPVTTAESTVPVSSNDGNNGDNGNGGEESNAAPVMLDLFINGTDEDTSLLITQDMLLATIQDTDGDPLTASNLAVTGGALADNGDGTWTFTPDPDFHGNISLNYDVSDGQDTIPANGSIVVASVNDAADVSGPTSFATSEDTGIVISEAQLLANASDVDGDTLSVQNLSADGGTLTDNGDGTWSFAPDADFNGTVNLSYDVNDGTTNTATTGTVSVSAVNDAADVSGPTSFTTSEDTGIVISEAQLLANASDVDGDTLSVQNLSADGGTLTDNGDGTWSFAPDADFNGTINLSYDVNDGTTNTATTGTVSVSAINDGPTAGNVDLGATAEDTGIVITEAQLLAGSSDTDGDALSVTGVSVNPGFGSLTDNGNGTWTFNPAQDVNADDVAFSFTVSDGTTTDTATAVLDITAVNDAADVSGPTSFSTSEDTGIVISEAQLLANASDVDGDTLSVQNLSADGGTLTDNGNGTWSFAPDADFNGTINLSYDVNDGTT